MAYIPQASLVAFPFSVSEVVNLGRYAAARGGDGGAVGAALARMDIADRSNDSFGELSAGQQQRVTVARALAQLGIADFGLRVEGKEAQSEIPSPQSAMRRVLLADEPVSAMDPSHSLRTMDLFESLAKEGMCVVVVLHDLSLVLRYAKRVLILGDDGKVAGEGETGGTLTPSLLSRVYGVGFRAIADPDNPGRAGALIPRR